MKARSGDDVSLTFHINLVSFTPMFTGIIEEVGQVKSLQHSLDTASLQVEARRVLEGLQLGDSIAVNGVCLTVRRMAPQTFVAELSQETLSRSSLGELKAGGLVNLERPLLPTTRLGGHFVQGHVDGIGKVLSIQAKGGFAVCEFSLPLSIRRYVVEKGSIAVDGISLTVASLQPGSFQVALIPHTLENTNFRGRKLGDKVNLECDVLAKYVESLLNKPSEPTNKPGLTEEYLRDQGY
jgi:riboflavin synthase